MTHATDAAGPGGAGDQDELVLVRATPLNAETPLAGLRAALTPAPVHYVRNHFAVPDHDGTLHLGGAVAHPLTLTLDDLRRLPAATLTVTLECAGNGRTSMVPLPPGEPWSGQAVATAAWTGVPLAEVMRRAGPRADAVALVFTGADHGPHDGGADIHYVRSLPVVEALRPEARVLLAYEMNGAALPPDHGAPLRLVVPRWYGMASVKWLARIEARTEPYEGQFQTRSYVYDDEGGSEPPAPVTLQRVKALITDPAPGSDLAAGHYLIRGKAWSGTGPVTRVEVSVDAGEWQEARLEAPGEPEAWQEWSFAWQATEIGRHALRARATDAAGHVQPAAAAWNRKGYGNNAPQLALVEVRRSSQ